MSEYTRVSRSIEYHNGSIELVHTAEGRMLPSGGSYTYEYMLKDHLGNIRAMVKSDGSIIDISDYYAFGLEIGDPITPSPDNKYKYNGKEWNTELSLNSYDYGARFYDPVVGRWNVADPLAEQMRSHSPYNYVFNNPMRFIDPDGMVPEVVLKTYEEAPDGWYKEDGSDEMKFDEKISSQADLNKYNLKGTFKGQSVLEINNGKQKSYNKDGSITSSMILDEVVFNGTESFDGNEQASKLNNAFGIGLSAKEGMWDMALRLDKTFESTKTLSALKTGTKFLGTTLGITGAISSGVDFYKSRTISNGVNFALDAALVPMGPVAGIVGGLAEASGLKAAFSKYLQDRADNYLIHQQ